MKKLIEIVLENRSLAENSPLKLLKIKICQDYFNSVGESKFIADINEILDEYE